MFLLNTYLSSFYVDSSIGFLAFLSEGAGFSSYRMVEGVGPVGIGSGVGSFVGIDSKSIITDVLDY